MYLSSHYDEEAWMHVVEVAASSRDRTRYGEISDTDACLDLHVGQSQKTRAGSREAVDEHSPARKTRGEDWVVEVCEVSPGPC